jgi:hypothetical protein
VQRRGRSFACSLLDSAARCQCADHSLGIGAFVRVALLIAAISIAWAIGNGIGGELRMLASSEVRYAIDATVVAALIIYIILMAVPFCPGIEVGLALIALMGREIVPLVYMATVTALLLSFAAGRFVDPLRLIDILALLRLRRAQILLQHITQLSADRRLQLLAGGDRPGAMRFLLRHRYAVVAVALNTPGNLVIGDGGGIALVAGFSRLFSFRGFALTVALAVAPVPLLLLLAGP